jgi:hypothetical protein
MKKTNLILICSIGLVIYALLFGCSVSTPTPSIEQMDKSPFTGDPCAAPCWHGLVIGESSENEALSKIPTLTFIDPNSIQLFRENSAPGLDPKDSNYAAQIIANCITVEEQCLVLRTESYILTEIELILNYEVTVQDAIRYLGVPDYIGYQKLGVAHDVLCELDVIWVSKQLILASEIFESYEAVERCGAVRETGKVESNLLISKVIYKTEGAIEILLEDGSRVGFFEFSETNP